MLTGWRTTAARCTSARAGPCAARSPVPRSRCRHGAAASPRCPPGPWSPVRRPRAWLGQARLAGRVRDDHSARVPGSESGYPLVKAIFRICSRKPGPRRSPPRPSAQLSRSAASVLPDRLGNIGLYRGFDQHCVPLLASRTATSRFNPNGTLIPVGQFHLPDHRGLFTTMIIGPSASHHRWPSLDQLEVDDHVNNPHRLPRLHPGWVATVRIVGKGVKRHVPGPDRVNSVHVAVKGDPLPARDGELRSGR